MLGWLVATPDGAVVSCSFVADDLCTGRVTPRACGFGLGRLLPPVADVSTRQCLHRSTLNLLPVGVGGTRSQSVWRRSAASPIVRVDTAFRIIVKSTNVVVVRLIS